MITGCARVGLVFCIMLQGSGVAQQFPSPENLTYRVEWRMITAGEAKMDMTHEQQNWQIKLNVESAGLVTRLFRVDDKYKVVSNDKFCGLNSSFEAQEGKRHVVESEQFDNSRHKATFDMHDLVKNVQEHNEVDIAPCTHEIIGALAYVRLMKIDPGKSITVPIVNGKKMAYAKIEAQAKESLTVDGQHYETVRYEAFIFDNVVFRKKGSMLMWLTDDAAHVPVQMRFQMGFPIGSITLELEKATKS